MENNAEPLRNMGKFFGEYLLHPIRTGAIAPSSPSLARTMVAWIDLPKARTVLEYGPGTGVFTGHIIRRMAADAKFAAIELNPRFAQLFRRRYPNLTLVDRIGRIGCLSIWFLRGARRFFQFIVF